MALFLHGQVSCNSYFNTDESSWFQGAYQSPYQGPFYSARHLSLIKTFLPLISQAVNHSLLLLIWESWAKQKCVNISCIPHVSNVNWDRPDAAKPDKTQTACFANYKIEPFKLKNWRSRSQNSHRLSYWSHDAPHKLISKQGEIWQQILHMIRLPPAWWNS